MGHLFDSIFGDLPKEQQEKLKKQLNGINEIVGLPKEE